MRTRRRSPSLISIFCLSGTHMFSSELHIYIYTNFSRARSIHDCILLQIWKWYVHFYMILRVLSYSYHGIYIWRLVSLSAMKLKHETFSSRFISRNFVILLVTVFKTSRDDKEISQPHFIIMVQVPGLKNYHLLKIIFFPLLPFSRLLYRPFLS